MQARAIKFALIAAPQLVFYKGNARARAIKLALIAAPQLVFYKVTY